MISEAEALQIAEQYLSQRSHSVDGGVAIIKDKTIQKPYGWIFFYNSRRYLETGSPLEALGGNGPVVVESASGRVHALSSAHSTAAAIAEFERLPRE